MDNYEQAYNELLESSLIPPAEEVAKELKLLEDEAIYVNGYCREYEEAIVSLRNPVIDTILRENRLTLEDHEATKANQRTKRRLVGAGVMGIASLPLLIFGGLGCPPLLVAAGAAFVGAQVQGYTLD